MQGTADLGAKSVAKRKDMALEAPARERRDVKRRVSLLLARFAILVLAAGCGGHVINASEPYQGKVVDAETKMPLKGAVVLAVWYREVPTAPHGPAVDYHDSIEILTDATGEFTVPEKSHFTLIGKIREPDFVVYYYPGYAAYPSPKAWPQGKEINTAYEKKVFRFELLRLRTHNERIKSTYPRIGISKVPETKMPNLTQLVNEERRKLGLKPIRLGR